METFELQSVTIPDLTIQGVLMPLEPVEGEAEGDTVYVQFGFYLAVMEG
jgi:hypothetical protein